MGVYKVCSLLYLLVISLATTDAKPKLFFIGANKMGTGTVANICRNIMDLRACHNCELNGKGWHEGWALEDYERYDCYSDHGNNADFKLLHRMFPDAAFVLQVRPTAAWLHSRFMHVARGRVQSNSTLSFVGDHSGCTGWCGNSESFIKAWMCDLYWHQVEVINYFSTVPSRFRIMDTTDMSTQSVLDTMTELMHMAPIQHTLEEVISNAATHNDARVFADPEQVEAVGGEMVFKAMNFCGLGAWQDLPLLPYPPSCCGDLSAASVTKHKMSLVDNTQASSLITLT